MGDLPESLNRARAAALAAARDVGENLTDAYRRATGSQATSEASRRGSPSGPARNGAVLRPELSAGIGLDQPARFAHENYLPPFSPEQPAFSQERPRGVRQFSDIVQRTPGPLEIGAFHGIVDAPAVARSIEQTQQRYAFPQATIDDPQVQARVRGIATGEGVPTRFPGPAEAPGRAKPEGFLARKSAAPPLALPPPESPMRQRGPREARNWLGGVPGVRAPADLRAYISGLENHDMPTEALRRVNHGSRMIRTQGALNMRPEGAPPVTAYYNPGAASSRNRAAFTPRMVRVQTPEEARALPAGTRYSTPDGTEYVR